MPDGLGVECAHAISGSWGRPGTALEKRCRVFYGGNMRNLGVFLLALATMTLAGCMQAPSEQITPPPTAEASPQQAVLSEVLNPQATTGPAASCAPGQFADSRGICLPCLDYEGCFTKSSDMYYFLNTGVELIHRFGASEFPTVDTSAKWLFVRTGATGDEGCTDGAGGRARYNDKSYEYCPSDRRVYVGEQSMWRYYTDHGDAAPIVGLAHEWGHHLQNLAGIVVRADHQREDILAQEIQADCVAGAWGGWANRQGIMDAEDDLKDVGSLMRVIADFGPTRQHGDLDERIEAFSTGYAQGVTACNKYVPHAPLVQTAASPSGSTTP